MHSSAETIEKAGEIATMSPPRWMVRTEKADFRRIVDARNAVGKPVLATEFDLLCDYIAARSRISLLRRMAKAAVDKCKVDRPEYRPLHPFGHEPAQRHAMALMRQCETATAACRRLARDLKLLDADG